MIFPAFRRRRNDSIAALYGAIVAQARSPVFYRWRKMDIGDFAVPRQMQEVGKAYYGPAASYDGACLRKRDHLVAALAKNIFSAKGDAPSGARSPKP